MVVGDSIMTHNYPNDHHHHTDWSMVLIYVYIILAFIFAAIVTKGQDGIGMFVLVIAAVATPIAMCFWEFWVGLALLVGWNLSVKWLRDNI
jgi:hypothetical protein